MKLVGHPFRSFYRSIRGRLTFPRNGWGWLLVHKCLRYTNTRDWIQLQVNGTENKCSISISSIFGTVFRYLPIFLTVLRYWVAWRCSPIKVRWPLRALTRNVRWNVCNEIHAAHIQSIWSEAEFIIINWNNIKLFHFTISGDRKIVFFFTYISRIC